MDTRQRRPQHRALAQELPSGLKDSAHQWPRPGYRIFVQTNKDPPSIYEQAGLAAAALPCGRVHANFPSSGGTIRAPCPSQSWERNVLARGAEDLHLKRKVQRTRLQ